MKTKICTICGEEKPETNQFFYFRKDSGKFRNECKKCVIKRSVKYKIDNFEIVKIKYAKYYKKFPWKRTFNNIIQRCSNLNHPRYKDYGERGIECRITEDELKELWFRDRAYEMNDPTIDRIDNNGHYEYGNCKYMERSENSKKRALTRNRNKKGIFLNEY